MVGPGSAGQGLGMLVPVCLPVARLLHPAHNAQRAEKELAFLLLLLSPLPPNGLPWTLESDTPGFRSQFYCLINYVNLGISLNLSFSFAK